MRSLPLKDCVSQGLAYQTRRLPHQRCTAPRLKHLRAVKCAVAIRIVLSFAPCCQPDRERDNGVHEPAGLALSPRKMIQRGSHDTADIAKSCGNQFSWWRRVEGCALSLWQRCRVNLRPRSCAPLTLVIAPNSSGDHAALVKDSDVYAWNLAQIQILREGTGSLARPYRRINAVWRAPKSTNTRVQGMLGTNRALREALQAGPPRAKTGCTGP